MATATARPRSPSPSAPPPAPHSPTHQPPFTFRAGAPTWRGLEPYRAPLVVVLGGPVFSVSHVPRAVFLEILQPFSNPLGSAQVTSGGQSLFTAARLSFAKG